VLSKRKRYLRTKMGRERVKGKYSLLFAGMVKEETETGRGKRRQFYNILRNSRKNRKLKSIYPGR